MPYGSATYSPSLRKQEGNMRYSRASQRRGFNMGRLIGDPFALATISIAILAWLIAFVGAIIAAIQNSLPNYSWWAIAYILCCIIGVILMVGGDAIYTYHVAASSFLSCGLFLSTSAVNSLVYSPKSADEAAAAGFILLSIVQIVWIFYFGSQPQATPRRFVDSFALHQSMEDRPSPRSSRMVPSRHFDNHDTSFIHNQPRAQYTSSHLPAGFETSSPVMNQTANPDNRNSQYNAGSSTGATFGGPQPQPSNPAFSQHTGTGTAGDSEVPQPTEYPFKARAIYSYEANPEDANEIGFSKHEILEVSDVSGRWWQARKVNGETGIAPSNYLILL